MSQQRHEYEVMYNLVKHRVNSLQTIWTVNEEIMNIKLKELDKFTPKIEDIQLNIPQDQLSYKTNSDVELKMKSSKSKVLLQAASILDSFNVFPK